MAKRNMRYDGDELLRKTSKKVEVFDKKLRTLLDDMAETMAEFNGAGLAAVQVGLLKRLFIVDVGEGVTEFINPEILETSGEQDGPEGCLSFPGEYGMVKRPNHVKVRAQDRFGKWFEAEGDELYARAVCHENDHLDGVVFKDHVSRMLTDEEMDEDDEE
ncbi:MAG: peptide deformylase [Angelakisella sp.]